MAETPRTITVDITPTWTGILPALIAILVNGETVEARKTAEAELGKMAGLADRYVALSKRAGGPLNLDALVNGLPQEDAK